jgi:hypothetical protein
MDNLELQLDYAQARLRRANEVSPLFSHAALGTITVRWGCA